MNAVLTLLYNRRRLVSRSQSVFLERYAYHGTSKSNLRAIRAAGLVPQVGDNTENDEGKDTEAKVCLALDKFTAREYAGKDGVVIKVDLDDPELAGAAPQTDKYTPRAVTVNQRIPPEAIQVVKRGESRALRLARITDGYARDQRLKAQVKEADWRPSPEKLALDYGFVEDYRQGHGKLGSIVRFFHPTGDRLIVTSRHDLERPISQHAHWQDRLKGVSGNWDTSWEYHTVDGTRSKGFDVFGLEQHLKAVHGSHGA